MESAVQACTSTDWTGVILVALMLGFTALMTWVIFR